MLVVASIAAWNHAPSVAVGVAEGETSIALTECAVVVAQVSARVWGAAVAALEQLLAERHLERYG